MLHSPFVARFESAPREERLLLGEMAAARWRNRTLRPTSA